MGFMLGIMFDVMDTRKEGYINSVVPRPLLPPQKAWDEANYTLNNCVYFVGLIFADSGL
jgi:hypothetical protein